MSRSRHVVQTVITSTSTSNLQGNLSLGRSVNKTGAKMATKPPLWIVQGNSKIWLNLTTLSNLLKGKISCFFCDFVLFIYCYYVEC